jgi:hypothetical protein
MNKLRSFALYLTKFPRIKSILKYLYFRISLIFYKKKYSYKTKYPISEIKKGENFGGYYDRVISNNEIVVFHQIPKDINISNSIKIYANDLHLGSSLSWNWQQGTLLKMISSNEVIYNDIKGHNLISIIKNYKENKTREVPYPFYEYDEDKATLYGIDFKRLSKYSKDYGYYTPFESNIRDDDAIFSYNVNELKYSSLVPYSRLHQLTSNRDVKSEFVNHLLLSPDKNKFIFIYRRRSVNNELISSLVLYDLEINEASLIVDEKLVSHCCWFDNTTIIGWFRYNGKIAYHKLNIYSGENEIIGETSINSDGHPSISKNQKWMITDTYPDNSRMSKLILFDLVSNESKELGVFFSPLKFYGNKRCDLHPRICHESNSITFDSTHTGKRKVYKMYLKDIKLN